ncbi:MAG: hypothetical protein PHW74_10315 [Desulfobacca sp.]|nr:hypothetical protein [Desulfobacca sp.]
MDQKQIVKQLVNFQKTTFDQTFNALTMLQEQTERVTELFWDNTLRLPQESRKAMTDWLKPFKQGCEDYKKLVDTGFKNVEALLG